MEIPTGKSIECTKVYEKIGDVVHQQADCIERIERCTVIMRDAWERLATAAVRMNAKIGEAVARLDARVKGGGYINPFADSIVKIPEENKNV